MMLSMGLTSGSSTSSTAVINNAVEFVTVTKGLRVRTSVILPLTYSNGHELITACISTSIIYSENLVVIKQGTANRLAHAPFD